MKKILSLILVFSLSFPIISNAQILPLLTTGNILPSTPCVIGSTFVLVGGINQGFYICGIGTFGNIWVPLVAAVAIAGTSLPSTCIVGALFTILPLGIVYVCNIPNHWNQSDGEKVVTGIQNNVFTDILTFTVPNESVGGMIEIVMSGSLGVGGAIGAHEASSGRTLLIGFTRVINLSMDVSIITTANVPDTKVIGGANIALTTQLGAITGLATTTQIVTLQARIARGSGASNNHIVTTKYRLISDDGPSLTIF